ncbi:hypothetical protein C0992_009077 [Termitomyces sp. T32_za158]|nr:hypothetical protein C0992_009077 [Termitomyces sp. T32_za158]
MAETSSHPEIFDSLPYYDDDLQKFPELKLKVEQELAREPKPPSTLHPRVPPSLELFSDRLGKQLTSLETRWTELISSVLQIEMANVALDAEIEKLNKREVELSEL